MKIKKIDVPFTQVANSVLNDKRLSWKAKGIFAYIYSKPDTYDFSTHRMKNDAKDEMKPLVAGVKELETCGYLVRKRQTNGRVQYQITHEPDVQNGTKPKRQHAKTAPVSNTDSNSNTDKESNTPASAGRRTSLQKGSTDLLDLSGFVEYMRSSPHRHVRLIGEYAEEAGLPFTTEGEWYVFMRRNLKIAAEASPFSDERIAEAMEEIHNNIRSKKNPNGYISEWTMETLVKFLLKGKKK